ncbi:Kelch repeat-containing protein [Streptomyces sp. NPDC059918]|uniref:Kelch repeat-containing protein n=1 Tax=unclassified Streptomyces TaxID=2593676 RepID=UPI003650A68E
MGEWAFAGALNTSRQGHFTTTLLNDGRVLVTGGLIDPNSGVTATAEAEIFTGEWSKTAPMSTTRAYHTATVLKDGRVLVTGGLGPTDTLITAELYDPRTGTWTPAQSMNVSRSHHTADLLPDGRVLVTGGLHGGDAGATVTATSELYDPATNTWTRGDDLHSPRLGHTTAQLSNGQILTVGGADYDGTAFSLVETTEMYVPQTQTPTPTTRHNPSTSPHTNRPPHHTTQPIPTTSATDISTKLYKSVRQ